MNPLTLLAAYLDYVDDRERAQAASRHPEIVYPTRMRQLGETMMGSGLRHHELIESAPVNRDRQWDWNEHIVELRRDLYLAHDLAHWQEANPPKFDTPWDDGFEEAMVADTNATTGEVKPEDTLT
jgi:hypothetical protein